MVPVAAGVWSLLLCCVDVPIRHDGSVQERLEDDTGREEAGARRPAGHDAAEFDGVELVRLARAAVLERPAGGAVEDDAVGLVVPLGPFGDDVGDDAPVVVGTAHPA